MAFSPAQRRYTRLVLLLSIIYALLLFAAVYLLSRQLVSGALAYVVGVLPALPVTGFFLAMGRYLIEEKDEYLRALQIRQLLIATGVALAASTIWGFLEGFDLVPHVVAYAWPIVWFAGLGLGSCVNAALARRAAL